MMVNAKKMDAAESWRPSSDSGDERGLTSSEHSLGIFKVDDPVEALVESYDFSALHDRIMMAVSTQVGAKARSTKSSRKSKLS